MILLKSTSWEIKNSPLGEAIPTAWSILLSSQPSIRKEDLQTRYGDLTQGC